MRISRLAACLLPAACALTTVFCLELSAPAQTLAAKKSPPKAGAQIWTLNFKKGDVSRHRNRITLTAKSGNDKGDLSMVFTSVEKVEVKDVSARNEATVVHQTEAFQAIINGKPQPIGNAALPPATQIVGKNGLLIKQLDEDPQTANTQMAVVQTLLSHHPVPNAPVKIGDVWKTDLENRLVPGKKVALLSTFAGTEKMFGIDTLKVNFQITLPTSSNGGDNDAIRAKGVYNLNPKNGELVRFDTTVQNVEIPLQAGLVKGTIEVRNVLIVPGVNDKPEAETGSKKK